MAKTIKISTETEEASGIKDLLEAAEQVVVKIGELKNHPLNPRRGQVSKIKESIKANGYYPTIFFQLTTNHIIKGNHTFLALKELNSERKTKGMYESFKANSLDVDDATALRILLMDNRTGDDSSYDTEVLYKALLETDEQNITGLYGTGWGEEHIDALARQIGIKTDIVDMTKEQKEQFINEETGRATISKDDVPDALFASDNEYDIPTLSLTHMADFIDVPVLAWGGQRGRKGKTNVGTYHFYTTDSHIEPLWKNPSHIVNTVVKVCTEINFSIYPQTPKAIAYWHTYRKRWIARYLQSFGVKILVDLNVTETFNEINMLGVPDGWRSFSMRGTSMYVTDGTMDRWIELARKKAGTEDIIVLVVGGAKTVENWCKKNNFVWVPDEMSIARGGADDKLELTGNTSIRGLDL